MNPRLGKLALRIWAMAGFAYVLLPLALVIWLSFFDNEIPSVPPRGYTLKWFAQGLANPQFADGLRLSLEVALIATFAGLLVSVPATLVLRRSSSAASRLMVQLLTAPLVVPTIVLGAGIYVMLIVLEMITGWTVVGALWALALAHVLIAVPWCVRLLLANLATVDDSIEEAASSLGGTPIAVFFTITLPLIRSGVVAAVIFCFVTSFGNIELSLFLVAPGSTTFPIAVLQYLQFKLDPTVAAVSVLQILLIGTLLLICDRFIKLTQVV